MFPEKTSGEKFIPEASRKTLEQEASPENFTDLVGETVTSLERMHADIKSFHDSEDDRTRALIAEHEKITELHKNCAQRCKELNDRKEKIRDMAVNPDQAEILEMLDEEIERMLQGYNATDILWEARLESIESSPEFRKAMAKKQREDKGE